MFLNDQNYKLSMSDRKGMSTTLVVAVTAIIILIVALVILTIFGGGIGQVSTIVEARNSCELQGRSSCAGAGSLPITWGFPFKAGDQTTSCYELVTVPGATDANPCGSWKA